MNKNETANVNCEFSIKVVNGMASAVISGTPSDLTMVLIPFFVKYPEITEPVRQALTMIDNHKDKIEDMVSRGVEDIFDSRTANISNKKAQA